MTEGNFTHNAHSYDGPKEEHWRVYGNEAEMIDMDHNQGAPGANENMAEDIAIENIELETE